MLNSFINAGEFLLIFVLACVVLGKSFKYMKEFAFGKDGISVKFDFYIDTKEEPKDPTQWSIMKIGKDKEPKDLSLEDFKYFVINNIWKQIPLSDNDRNNFTAIKSLYEGAIDNDLIIKKYWQRNYLFNIKFNQISKMVKSYKAIWEEVLRG